MKRPSLVTITILLQTLLGLSLAAVAVYVLLQTRSPEITAEPDAADTIRGLEIGAAVLGGPAIVTLISVIGLWKKRFWGWVLAIATDVGILAVLAYSMLDDNSVDGEMATLTVVSLVPLVLLVVPAVRRYYWNSAANIALGQSSSNGVSP